MTQVAFDTLKLARGLESAGFEHEQAIKTAEVFSENLTGTVVTREHFDHRMELFDQRIDGLRKDTKADIESLRKDTKADIESLRKDTKADLDIAVSELKGEMRLVKWMLALVIVSTVIPLIRDFL